MIKGLPKDKLKINHDFMEEIWAFDVRKLEQVNDIDLSKYIIALAQYLVYLESQINSVKSQKYQKVRFRDNAINSNLTTDVLKRYKTKANAVSYLLLQNKELENIQKEIDILNDELTLTDGLNRSITELIAAFKRELTRRQGELNTARMERR